MNDRPRLLDLYGGVGCAAAGYVAAGWAVTSVDLHPQPNNPFGFVQADAIEYLLEHGHEYDAVHASPPCQDASFATPTSTKGAWGTFDHIRDVRAICDDMGLPCVIENVVLADTKHHEFRRPQLVVEYNAARDVSITMPVQRPIVLCGTMFGLPLLKHRVFEVGAMVSPLAHPEHTGSVANGDYITVAGHGPGNAAGNNRLAAWQRAMGVYWATTRHELAEGIPPAYTCYIGQQMLAWGW